MTKTRVQQTILIIDDDEATRLVVRNILSGVGYLIEESVSMSDGITNCLEKVPHLIVLDLRMPNESGFEFLEKRMNFQKISQIPVLVLSGLKDRESVYKALSFGASDYLTKPIDARTLIQKVWKVLRDQRFPVIQFTEDKQPIVQARVNGIIIMANEAGFLVRCPIKIAPETQVAIQSSLLESLACTTSVFQKTDKIAKTDSPGQYLNEIAVVGLSSASVSRIREIVRRWR